QTPQLIDLPHQAAVGVVDCDGVVQGPVSESPSRPLLHRILERDFTNKNIRIHPQTYKLYTDALAKYGLLLIISQKPLRCKLLKHHFIIDLLKFFNKKTKFYKPKEYNFTKEINKEMKKYRKNLRINPQEVQQLEKKDEINFIHTSLSLEGNPITLPETQKLILKNIIPKTKNLQSIQEINNYKKTVDLMIQNTKRKIKLNYELIMKYHELTMNHITEAGIIRKQNVIIKNNPDFKTSNWINIEQKLNNLLEKYEEFEKEKRDVNKIIGFASYFHNEFQRIHPFIDGNSRTSRLLMLHILRKAKIPMLDIPIGYSDQYLDLTKKSKKRDDKALKNLIGEIILTNLKNTNRRIK
ncbi:MAG: Fic family protein, partial [Nanoarchaeota archaeon]|nr:Fic family protein [Nanoarchaeota archaeon]MBU1855024.1 Fic family protein [Nanoarchaeota archaeon]